MSSDCREWSQYKDIKSLWGGKELVWEAEKEIAEAKSKAEDSGGSCDYYKVHVGTPTTAWSPYVAECNDIIEALDMTYAEANMFKEIWRTASARTLGKQKANHTSKRGAEKIVFFANRHAIKHGA